MNVMLQFNFLVCAWLRLSPYGPVFSILFFFIIPKEKKRKERKQRWPTKVLKEWNDQKGQAGFCGVPISRQKSKPKYNLQGKKEREKAYLLFIWKEKKVLSSIKLTQALKSLMKISLFIMII